MGSTNYGTQSIIGKFQTELSGKNIGNVKAALRPGIYEGLTVTRVDDDSISISPGSFEIRDVIAGVQVRIATSNSIPWDVDDSKPYVVFRYEYADTDNVYADVINCSDGDLLENDVIICKCNFETGVLSLTHPFDYTERTDARYCKVESYVLDGTKDGSNLEFYLPSGFPNIRPDQYYILFNGLILINDVSYEVDESDTSLSSRKITIINYDPPQSTDDLRAVVISH